MSGTPGGVVWHRLVLRGFGPFRDEVAVEFPGGLAHFVAPNEFGKSTLVERLAAVLFGLPVSSDPAAFGRVRYRHWGGAARFEGEVEFTAADGQRYRVWRDFDAHRVRLERLGTKPEVLFDSTHNPPGAPQERQLRRAPEETGRGHLEGSLHPDLLRASALARDAHAAR